MMNSLLSTSARLLRRGAGAFGQDRFDFSPEALRPWIRSLPLNNQKEATQLIIEALRHLNHSLIPLNQRAAALALFTPLINTLLKRHCYRKNPDNTRLMGWRQREQIEMMQQMLSEISHGYQIVINESPSLVASSETSFAVGSEHHRYCSALYYALEHLAQRLLLSYLIYAEPPTGVWSELHRLYATAEKDGITATPFNIGPATSSGQQRTGVIEHTYKQILLLSLANPYHLMPNEAIRAYQSLRRWAPQCRILKTDEANRQQGRFYIDLTSDLPPTHHTQNQLDNNHDALRLLDIAEILPAGQHQRALDRRLPQALIIRPERLARRTTASADITLAYGLEACHHFISNSQREKPALSLTEQQRDNRTDPAIVKLTSRSSEHTSFDAKQHDISIGGLALQHRHPQHFLPSGALIIYHDSNQQNAIHWSIGTVKWSRRGDNNHQLGIKSLADDAAAVATRLFNNNEQEPWQIALLTPDEDPLVYPTTLITAQGLYRAGDTIQIHTDRRQLVVELTQLIENTWAFSHYRFRLIASQAH